MPYFSPSTTGFYDPEVHSVIPGDALEVTAEVHRALIEAQANGLLIVAGPSGLPIATAQPAPTAEQVMANLRAERDALLAQSDWTQVPDAPFSDEERQAWASYRQALRDLPKTCSNPADIDWPTAPTNEDPA